MATWLHKLRVAQSRDANEAAERGPKTPSLDELGMPSARITRRDPLENDNNTTTVFRTWTTPSGIPRHSKENGRTALSLNRASSADLQSFQVKFKQFLQQLERRVQLELRSCPNRSPNHNRDVYQKFLRMVRVGNTEFQNLMVREFGISLSSAENQEIFKRFGKNTPEGVLLNIENHLSRIIRNEAAVGVWGGAEAQPMGVHMGLSIEFREDSPTSFKRRSGSIPLQPQMGHEDSRKLLTFNKTMTNYDGTLSNFNPNKLGDPGSLGVALSPEFKPRHPAQRLGRRCQPGIMGQNDKYNDSAMVRGYTDQWVVPCGDGAWSVDPNRGGNAIKVGENMQGPKTIRAPSEVEMNHRVIVKAPINSHMMTTHQAKKASGIRVVGGADSQRSFAAPQSRRSMTPVPLGHKSSKPRHAPMLTPPRSRSSAAQSTCRGGAYDARQELFTPASNC